MATLIFDKVQKDVENTSFDCGIQSINGDVRESYYYLITQQAYTYSVKAENGRVLGFYQIHFREITIEDFPEEISDYQTGAKHNTIAALHIRFIAVDKNIQKKRIGNSILQTIIMDIKKMSKVWPVRVITLDARTELVHWYEKCGFRKMVKNTEGQDGVTVAMFLDCMHYSEALEEYVMEMTC